MTMVKEFYWNIVLPKYRKKFLELMIEWDGSKSVYDAFYQEDVLWMKYREAKEIVG